MVAAFASSVAACTTDLPDAWRRSGDDAGKPSETEPSETEPSETEPTEPSETEPTEPMETDPTETEPSETEHPDAGDPDSGAGPNQPQEAGPPNDAAVDGGDAEGPEPELGLLSSTPSAGEGDVSVDTDLEFVFGAAVEAGAGMVTVREVGGDPVQSIPVPDPRISVNGATVSIDLAGGLAPGTEYEVRMSAGSFQGEAGGIFPTGELTVLRFTTQEEFGLAERTPSFAATSVDPATDLVLTFNRDIALGTGNIEVRTSTGNQFETIPISDPRVMLDGNALRVDIDSILRGATDYSVLVDADAIREASGSGIFPGFASLSDWTFRTQSLAAPGNVASGLEVWLDASHVGSVKADTGVRLWADRSGQQRDVVQSTANQQPALVTINSRRMITFDGSNDSLSLPNGLSLSGFHGFVVWRSGALASTSAQRSILLNGNSVHLHHGHTSGASRSLRVYASNTWYTAQFAPAPAVDTTTLWDFAFDTVTTSLAVRSQGGAAVYVPDPTQAPAAPGGPFAIGGSPTLCASQNGCHFEGAVAEVILYSRHLTQSERRAVTDYLRQKWAIPDVSCASDATLGPNGSCYFRNASATSWWSARAACQARGAGWDLVSIRSAADNSYLGTTFAAADFWIGASDNTLPNNWIWVNDTSQFWNGTSSGSPTNGAYANWTPGEPSAGDPEACARFVVSGNTWNDANCNDNHGYVCEGPGN